MNVSIVKATMDNVKDIIKLEKEAIICPWSESVLISSMANENSFFFVALFKDNFCGYGGGNVVFDEAEVYNIAVKEEYRGAKIGKMILEKIITESANRGANKIFLEVAENNNVAINLYEKSGFKKISERKNYYNKVAAYVYEKQL